MSSRPSRNVIAALPLKGDGLYCHTCGRIISMVPFLLTRFYCGFQSTVRLTLACPLMMSKLTKITTLPLLFNLKDLA